VSQVREMSTSMQRGIKEHKKRDSGRKRERSISRDQPLRTEDKAHASFTHQGKWTKTGRGVFHSKVVMDEHVSPEEGGRGKAGGGTMGLMLDQRITQDEPDPLDPVGLTSSATLAAS
jgi:hypothetical protein